MWLERLRMRLAEPLARGRIRRIVVPSSTYACEMNRFSMRSAAVCSAFAAAEATTLYTGSLAACGANCSIARASTTSMPRTMSTTRRTFIGVMRT